MATDEYPATGLYAQEHLYGESGSENVGFRYPVDEDIDDLLEYGEELDGALTNEVYRARDVAIKEYEKLAPTQVLANTARAAGDIAGLSFPEWLRRSDRMDMEEAFKHAVRQAGAQTAATLQSDDSRMVFPYIDAEPLSETLETYSPDDAYDRGQRVGTFLKNLQENDDVMIDNRLGNYLDGDELSVIDHEVATTDGTWLHKLFDMIQFSSSARHLDPETHDAFMSGVEDAYGSLGPHIHGPATALTFIHAAYESYENDAFDDDAFSNAGRNTWNLLRNKRRA